MTSWMCLCCQLVQECFRFLLMQCFTLSLCILSSFVFLSIVNIGCSCDLFCYVFLQQVINQTGFHPLCPMNQVQSLNKKGASCERHKKLNRIVYTVHLHSLRSPGVGRNSAEGHLPYALRVRPQTKAHQMQAGQPARQPDPPQSGGGEQRLRGG